MFTGLIENIGTVSSIKRAGGGLKISICPESAIELQIGDSVSINGACLTVVETGRDIAFEVSPETLRNTNLGELKVNDKVNIERALRLSDRLGGHLVTGHIDGIGVIIDKRQEGDYTFYTFEAHPKILKYTVEKGSIAVDGISLTVIGLDMKSFTVAIIPHTLTATNIGSKGIGDKVNLEVDIIGKYVEKFVSKQNNDPSLMELLKEKGFTT
ncbi:MAG: riboflavin synthase [Thermodesulfovibrionia bacterium]|nr:riboflavin synthase [Thermodesulfovibrionia bacterium]